MEPKLKPLHQWVCDICGEIIEKPEDGYIQFHYQDSKCDDIIIVHHLTKSPRREYNEEGCYKYQSDLDLKSYLSHEGIARMISRMDLGEYHEPDYEGPRVSDIRKWADVFRRLQIPYYEEARLYWNRALNDGYFDGANEIWPYLPQNLEMLIRNYGE